MDASAKITYGPQIAIVGAGPRGTSILERISASATHFIPGDSWLTIHLIDQYPPGAGKVWRTDQSRLLWMNTVASQVTLFTDETVKCDGPIVSGPTLHQWLKRNLHTLGPNDFATRVQCGTYLRWVYDYVIERLPSNVRVKLHVAEARAIKPVFGPDGTDTGLCNLELSTGKINNLSAVILAQGHLPRELDGAELARKIAYDGWARNGERNSVRPRPTYIPPCNAPDADLSEIKPESNVLLIGMGLSFFDYLSLLSEGLGGEYVRENCVLKYKRSGREPTMYSFSRRGLPLHARGRNQRTAENRLQPRVLTKEAIDEFQKAASTGNQKDFRDLWRLIAFEVEIVYYVQLLRARDEPTVAFEKDYLACIEALDNAKHTSEERTLLQQLIHDQEQKWNIQLQELENHQTQRRVTNRQEARTDTNLTKEERDELKALKDRQAGEEQGIDKICNARKEGVLQKYNITEEKWSWEKAKNPEGDEIKNFTTVDEWKAWILNYLKEDVRQAQLGNVHGPHAAARSVLRDFRDLIRLIVDYKGIKDEHKDLSNRFLSLNSFLSIGPPLERIEQMIALMNAGILTVLAPDTKVTLNTDGWSVTSEKFSGLNPSIRMTVLIESRMQKPTVKNTSDKLLKYLANNSMCRQHTNASYVTDGLDVSKKPYHVYRADGREDPRLFAIGIPTEGVRWITTTLPTPQRNSVELLATDAVARGALRKAQKDLKSGKIKD